MTRNPPPHSTANPPNAPSAHGGHAPPGAPTGMPSASPAGPPGTGAPAPPGSHGSTRPHPDPGHVPTVAFTPSAKPSAAIDAAIRAVGDVYVGDKELLRKVAAAALANGHVLFEDLPGLGKTLLMKAFARALGCHGSRIQFTPDLMPADILGTKVWDVAHGGFRLEKGPVFTNVLLADEINRAPPKTQSALLEVMEERQVTIEGQTFRLEPPFFVVATQNPLEQEGTYPLPEAQMDRFLMRLTTGYPADLAAETTLLRRRVAWRKDDPSDDVPPVFTQKSFRALQMAVETQVFVHEDMLGYMAEVVRRLREHALLEVGPSPRGTLALLRASRAMALVRDRAFVTPDDVRDIAVECLAHRCIVDVEKALEGARAEHAVRDVLNQVRVPDRLRRGD